MSKWSAAYRDSRWQQKRLEVMNRDEWACRSCGAGGEGITLNVHHSHYEAGKAPWEYANNTLVTWCEDCHKERHKIIDACLEEFAFMPMGSMKGLLAIAMGDFGYALEVVGKHNTYNAQMKAFLHEVIDMTFCANEESDENKENEEVGDVIKG